MLRLGIGGVGALVAAGVVLDRAPLAALLAGASAYGPLGPADPWGVRVPEGFSARAVAISGQLVEGTNVQWHTFPDGGATFTTDGGGWVYVSNSEVPGSGGVGSLSFDRSGAIVGAARPLEGTSRNCAGGATPWGAWLSCEEVETGLVWETDPLGNRPARQLPALGRFNHEAAAVDERRGHVYLTEDAPDGLLYRFTPREERELADGRLEAMAVAPDGEITWVPVADPLARDVPTRSAPGATPFDGGEGAWFDGDQRLYFTTKGDGRVWRYAVEDGVLEVVYDSARVPQPPVLTGVDNLTGTPRGEVLVAEDTGAHVLELVAIAADGSLAPLVQVVGHDGSELAGPAFSPDGSRLYFSSQRGGRFPDGTLSGGQAGVTFEVTGPFAPPRSEPTATTAGDVGGEQTSAAPPPDARATSDSGDDDIELLPLTLGGAAAVAAVAAGGALWLRGRRRSDEPAQPG
jgi:secreted PhoX family phosphatase